MKTPTSSDAREERGRQLARAVHIRQVGRRWAVPSQSRASERYLVDVEDAACTCPDYELRRGTCKHQHAVLFWIAWGRDVDVDGNVTETVTVKREVKRKTYRQNAAATGRRIVRKKRDSGAGVPSALTLWEGSYSDVPLHSKFWYAVDQGTYHITPVSNPDQPRDVRYDLRFNKKPFGWEKIGPNHKTLKKAVSAAQLHYATLTRYQ